MMERAVQQQSVILIPKTLDFHYHGFGLGRVYGYFAQILGGTEQTLGPSLYTGVIKELMTMDPYLGKYN